MRIKRILIAGLVGSSLVFPLTQGFSVSMAEKAQKTNLEQKFCSREVIVRKELYTGGSFQYKNCFTESLSEEYIRIRANTTKDYAKVVEVLQGREDVVSIQPNFAYSAMEVQEPNDKYFSQQWALKNEGIGTYENQDGETVQAEAGIDVNALKAWDSFKSKKKVIVAVIDTGIDYKHEDLKKSMWTNEGEIPGNNIDDDGNGYVDDIHGWDFYHNDKSICAYNKKGQASSTDNDNHGTHCAGIIGATANNKVGVAGVASNVNVQIMAIKALGGANSGTTTARLIQSIKYAMAMKADIINASWGGSVAKDEDIALKKIIKRSGVLFVAAAGNNGKNADVEKCYPACYSTELDNVISVGAIESDGTRAEFSNYGTSIDILAPGSRIYSTKVGGYAYKSGTSMAAPMVAGVAAMLYAGKEHIYPSEVKQAILDSYRELSTVTYKDASHPGIVDAYQAVQQRSSLKEDKDAPNITELWSEYNGTMHLKVNDMGEAGISGIFYARGSHGKSYFRHGARGTIITKNKVVVKKSGYYTVFVKDNAGNETLQKIKIVIDKKAPSIQATRKKNGNIEFQVKDSVTGLAFVKYAYGKQNKAYFTKGNGKNLKLNKSGKATLKKKKTEVTIYAVDRAGNVNIKIYKCE